MVNFGIIYGISLFGLGQRLDIKHTKAKALIDNYFEKYPGIKTYMDQSIAFAKEHLYVETIMAESAIKGYTKSAMLLYVHLQNVTPLMHLYKALLLT